ncbi:MAG: OmpA family protein [Ignavibacteria bacterium]|nr:OmpA family protein [Ignavibacteria bacterium]
MNYIERTICGFILFLLIVRISVFAEELNSSSNRESEYYLYGVVIEEANKPESPQIPTQDQPQIFDKAKIRIINLGSVVNWRGLDYAPSISADGRTLYFVSNRPGSMINPKIDKPSHDFWASKKNERLDTIFFRPFNIDTTRLYGYQGVNTPENEGVASIAADGQTLYFTACMRPDGLGDCDIYRSTIEGDRWSRPYNLGPNVNSKYFDAQPSIAPDQSRLYFVSTRPGPNSDGNNEKWDNMDIWYCDWDPINEEWLPAKNFSEINTPVQDAGPFIAADNQTFFFSSKGHKPNLGGLDFYVTRYDPETKKWSTPENLGEPLNTPQDDQFITLPASGDVLYFSSRRKDIPGYQGDFDIFMAFVPAYFRAVVVKVRVIDECSGDNLPAYVTIRNPITKRVAIDSLRSPRVEMDFVVTSTDYGDPRDSIMAINLEITAENPKYGKVTKTVTINKPKPTTDPEEAKKYADEIKVVLPLGQLPSISTEIDEAKYVAENKSIKPELAKFRGLVMEQFQTWDLYPLLNYVFFDLGSSKIPDRYILFKSPDDRFKLAFTDTTIRGGTLEKYYHILNIYGYRLSKFPDAKIEIVGCNDGKTPEEKRPNLSRERAEAVFQYFKNVWGIDEKRMKITVRNQPAVVSNLNDSLGIVENRRVEIICNDWNIMKPVFDKDPKTFPQPETMNFVLRNGIEEELIKSRRIEVKRGGKEWNVLRDIGITETKVLWDWKDKEDEYPKDEVPYTAQLILTTVTGRECASDPVLVPVMQVTTEQKKVDIQKGARDSTIERYNLILFPFDRADAGPINERIMREYVYNRVLPSSFVEVVGHTDIVGLYEHNQKLSERRATTVFNGIMKQTGGKVGFIIKRGVGEDEPLYDNSLPEGRFYNRTVQVMIKTPIEAWMGIGQ